MGITYHYSGSGHIEFILTRGEARHYPRHIHMRHWTAGWVHGGSVTLTTSEGTRKINAGQHYFIHPHEPHSLDVGSESSLLVFCFDSIHAFKEGETFLRQFSPVSPLFETGEKSLADAIGNRCNPNPADRLNAPRNVAHLPDSTINRSVQAIMLLIQENPDRFSDIGQMAAYAGYSQWHFLRAFQKFTGITPHAFQLFCRLSHLRNLLRTDSTSAMAAALAGFFDQSHMHKVFKRHHGMTPDEFKQASIRFMQQ